MHRYDGTSDASNSTPAVAHDCIDPWSRHVHCHLHGTLTATQRSHSSPSETSTSLLHLRVRSRMMSPKQATRSALRCRSSDRGLARRQPEARSLQDADPVTPNPITDCVFAMPIRLRRERGMRERRRDGSSRQRRPRGTRSRAADDRADVVAKPVTRPTLRNSQDTRDCMNLRPWPMPFGRRPMDLPDTPYHFFSRNGRSSSPHRHADRVPNRGSQFASRMTRINR